MENILVKVRNGKKLALLAFSDIDGTVNNQNLPEKDRLGSIDDAKEAIEKLQDFGIPVGLITARSFGEALIYKNLLKTTGFIIAEDGAIIILPDLSTKALRNLSKTNHIISHKKEHVIILSKVELNTIQSFIKRVNKALNNPKQELITSCTSTPETLKKLINYQSLEDAKRGMDRLASAFIRNYTNEQFTKIKKYTDEWGLRVEGQQFHAHLIGKDADKGTAIKFVNDHISHIVDSKEIDGILPIVFGNDYNDLRLFEEANSMGGYGIIVKDSNDTYKVSLDKIPEYVTKTKGASGNGMKEGVNIILKKISILN